MKVQKVVSIDKAVNEHIKRRQREEGFNFSAWLASRYKEEFMSLSEKERQLAEAEARCVSLRKEIEELREREEAYSACLDVHAKRFLKEVPRLLREGKEWKALCKRFNVSFHADFTLEQFKKNVEYYQHAARKS